MLPLLLLIAGFVVGAVVTVWLVTRFAEKLTGKFVNERFRVAEFILEHHRPPQSWVHSASKPKLLGRLDTLISFFETCPFFEDEDTRLALLAQLRAERERWNTESLEGLLTRIS